MIREDALYNAVGMRQSSADNYKTARQRFASAISRVSWTYLIVMLILAVFLRTAADRWALATLILFGPLWVTSLPLAILVPLALAFHRRSLGVLALAGFVVAFPVLDLCVPWRPFLHGSAGGPVVRLITCNVHGAAFRPALFYNLVEETQPDIIVLQEAAFPWYRVDPPNIPGNWYFRRDGELLILSRFPIVSARDFGDPSWRQWGGSVVCYEIDAPGGTLSLVNLHLASPHGQFEAMLQDKPSAADGLQRHLAVRAEQSAKISSLADGRDGDIIFAGDFNTISQGSLYREYWSRFSDAFATAGFGAGHTYFFQGAKVRIDHILTGSAWRCTRCWVGPFIGSPHRPLIADLQRMPSQK